jgi:DNA-binding MarR family transcriptional regulator
LLHLTQSRKGEKERRLFPGPERRRLTPQMPIQNEELTEEVYRFIINYTREHGFAPSLRDIAAGCYVGSGTITRHLDRLEMMRRITREPGIARSIKIVDKKRES